ncbi:arsenate reductase family protein [Carboxylicivirga sp. RSCT41]|uniref:arsenate reductase family protein n=1 Tax=Carboxylicivirga agarovorans TaxID=3417570 RepID=UPI003D350271
MPRGKVYLLNSCNTCKRIYKQVKLFGDFEVRDVKSEPLSLKEVDSLASLTGGYELIFNKQSQKYRQQKLKDKNLSEENYRQLLSEEYTFLKRPVFIIDDKIFVGNSKSTVDLLTKYLVSTNK